MLGAAWLHAAVERASLDAKLVDWSLQEKAKVSRLLRALSRFRICVCRTFVAGGILLMPWGRREFAFRPIL